MISPLRLLFSALLPAIMLVTPVRAQEPPTPEIKAYHEAATREAALVLSVLKAQNPTSKPISPRELYHRFSKNPPLRLSDSDLAALPLASKLEYSILGKRLDAHSPIKSPAFQELRHDWALRLQSPDLPPVEKEVIKRYVEFFEDQYRRRLLSANQANVRKMLAARLSGKPLDPEKLAGLRPFGPDGRSLEWIRLPDTLPPISIPGPDGTTLRLKPVYLSPEPILGKITIGAHNGTTHLISENAAFPLFQMAEKD